MGNRACKKATRAHKPAARRLSPARPRRSCGERRAPEGPARRFFLDARPPMIADTLACLLLVLGVAFGLSRPVVDRMGLDPAEGLVAGAALSLLGAWGLAWAVFTTGAPLSAYWLVAAAAAAGLAAGRRGLSRLAADPAARDLLGRPAAGDRLVRGVALVRQEPLRRRLDRRLARALGEGPVLPARVAGGPAFSSTSTSCPRALPWRTC
jgi:hypothetical protein